MLTLTLLSLWMATMVLKVKHIETDSPALIWVKMSQTLSTAGSLSQQPFEVENRGEMRAPPNKLSF